MNFKFNFSKTALLVLAGGILTVTSGWLFIIYQSQMNQQEEMSSQLELTRQKISQLSTEALSQQQSDLKAQLVAIESDVANDQAVLTRNMQLIKDVGQFYRIALFHGVQIESISAAEAASGFIDKVPFQYYPLTLTVHGGEEQVNTFIRDLNMSFPTGWTKSVDMDITPAETRGTLPQVSARVEMNLNSYRGK